MTEDLLPKVSVVIINDHTPSLILKRCFQSVMEQSYTNVEIILLNVAKPDPSYDNGLLEDLEHYPDIISIHAQDDNDYPAAKNKALEACTGTYITFIHTGDVIGKERFSLLVEAFTNDETLDAILTNMELLQSDIVNQQKFGFSGTDYYGLSQIVFHRRVFTMMGTFDTYLLSKSDYEFWLRSNIYLHTCKMNSKELTVNLDSDCVIEHIDNKDAIAYQQILTKHKPYFRRHKYERKLLYYQIAYHYRKSKQFLRSIQFYSKAKLLFINKHNWKGSKKNNHES